MVSSAAGGSSRAVVFDLDGALVDSAPGILEAFSRTLADTGHAARHAELTALIGPPLNESFRSLGYREDELPAIVARYRRHYADIGVERCAPYPGIPALLARLRSEGRTLAVATAKRVDFARAILAAHRLDQHFAVIEGAPVDGALGPKSDIVRRACADLAPARAAVLVGDRRFDVAAAHACGLVAVGVTWGYGSLHELREAGTDAIATSPEDLAAILARAALSRVAS